MTTITEPPVTETPPSYYLLALDPGETTGWALFKYTEIDGKTRYVDQGQVSGEPEAINKLLDLLNPTIIVYEDFRLFAHRAFQQRWSRMPASRVIGMVESWAKAHNVKFYSQGADKKTLGYMYLGEKPPGNHKKSHAPDAKAHGMYFLVNMGMK